MQHNIKKGIYLFKSCPPSPHTRISLSPTFENFRNFSFLGNVWLLKPNLSYAP